jgi:hypothetical protein
MGKWVRLTTNIEPKLAKDAKTRAKAQRRSFAAYVALLIENDLKVAQVEEAAGSYITENKPSAKPPTHDKVADPPPGSRKRGAGPNAAISA